MSLTQTTVKCTIFQFQGLDIYADSRALKYESPEGTWGFLKKSYVNRYIELCNPFSRISNSFPRISNSFPRIGQLVLSKCNSFPRIGQLVLSDCNSLPPIRNVWFDRGNGLKLERTDCLIRGNELQFERTDFLLPGNELQSERTSWPIRGNELLTRENGLHNSILRFTYGFFLKIPMSLQGFVIQTPNRGLRWRTYDVLEKIFFSMCKILTFSPWNVWCLWFLTESLCKTNEQENNECPEGTWIFKK